MLLVWLYHCFLFFLVIFQCVCLWMYVRMNILFDYFFLSAIVLCFIFHYLYTFFKTFSLCFCICLVFSYFFFSIVCYVTHVFYLYLIKKTTTTKYFTFKCVASEEGSLAKMYSKYYHVFFMYSCVFVLFFFLYYNGV